MALATLAEAFGEKNLTPVRIEAYHNGLKEIPMPLINAAARGDGHVAEGMALPMAAVALPSGSGPTA